MPEGPNFKLYFEGFTSALQYPERVLKCHVVIFQNLVILGAIVLLYRGMQIFYFFLSQKKGRARLLVYKYSPRNICNCLTKKRKN